MTDPAIEAAHRVVKRYGDLAELPMDSDDLAAAAREMAKPIREKVEEWRQEFEDHGDDSTLCIALAFMDALAPLIYTSEEMER